MHRASRALVTNEADRTEQQRLDRIGWLRAAVLGANDGIVSTASLVIGVAAGGVSEHNLLLTGVAGLVAGAMSMAAGEYVSVHAQSDTEAAELRRLHLRAGCSAAKQSERGIVSARPLQAAGASACSFSVGAALPLIVTTLVPSHDLIVWIAGTSLVFLAAMGYSAARAGKAPRTVGALRVTLWGAAAMAVTAGVGLLFNASP